MSSLASTGGLVEVLYKYVTSERVLTCLPEVGDGTLRATQPAALNDPFECEVSPGLARADQLAEDVEIAEVLSSLNGATPTSDAKVREARSKYGSLFLRELLVGQLSQRYGIVSFSSDPRHLLMWAHYTRDGSGFVIGYQVDALRSLGRHEDSLREVRYETRTLPIVVYPVLSEENANILLSFKSDHWSYESEWRLIVELSDTIGTGSRDSRDLPINLVRVPNEAVVDVFHTERTPMNIVEEVRGRLQNPNNRYGVQRLTKLVASATRFGYEDASDGTDSSGG